MGSAPPRPDATRRFSRNGKHDPNDVPPWSRPPAREDQLALLGSIMADFSRIRESYDIVNAADFVSTDLAAIYRAFETLDADGCLPDPTAITSALMRLRLWPDDKLDQDRVRDTMDEICNLAVTAENIKLHAGHVAEMGRLRRRGCEVEDLLARIRRGEMTSDEVDERIADLCSQPCTASITRPPQRSSICKLIKDYPDLNAPIIDGLLRERETMNIISGSKAGKSWFLYGLLFSIATGSKWLGRFDTRRGRVLLIDNELHRPTIAHRLKSMASAMGLSTVDYLDAIDIWPLRGHLLDITRISQHVARMRERYALIALDAKYRAMPSTASENDNAAETQFHNAVDGLAEVTGSAVVMVHHAAKGAHGDKRVTDIGAGAGAQSRAVDTHLVLREHEEGDAVVLDAVARSFAPIEPMGLRRVFPLWRPDVSLDLGRVKGRVTAAEKRQSKLDAESDEAILEICETWKTRKELRKKTGFGGNRINRAIARLLKAAKLECREEDRLRHPDSEVFRRRS